MVFLVFPKNVRDKFNLWRERNILLKILFRRQTKQLLSVKLTFKKHEKAFDSILINQNSYFLVKS